MAIGATETSKIGATQNTMLLGIPAPAASGNAHCAPNKDLPNSYVWLFHRNFQEKNSTVPGITLDFLVWALARRVP